MSPCLECERRAGNAALRAQHRCLHVRDVGCSSEALCAHGLACNQARHGGASVRAQRISSRKPTLTATPSIGQNGSTPMLMAAPGASQFGQRAFLDGAKRPIVSGARGSRRAPPDRKRSRVQSRIHPAGGFFVPPQATRAVMTAAMLRHQVRTPLRQRKLWTRSSRLAEHSSPWRWGKRAELRCRG